MQQSNETQLMELQSDYVLGTYAPELLLVKGEMSWLWDVSGRRYLDFGTGISVCNLGHCHPRVSAAVREQVTKLMHVSNLYFNETQPRLAELIARNSFNGRSFFCNSGAEANEGLIKVARRWGHQEGRYEIICMEESFHGRTLATLAATGREKYRKGFAPYVEGFVHVPFNDVGAVRDAIGPKTVAVLVEPVQGEGGVIPAEREFLTGLRELCDERNLLLLFDEVQCGMGRTGQFFAHQHFGVEPDAMSMAKALGNGFPIGAFEVQRKHEAVLPPSSHASTFGGTPLACAAGIAVFETFAADGVLENCREMSALLWAKLGQLQQTHSCIRQVRGLGLMIGLVLDVPVKGIITAARERGLLVLSAGDSVLRLLPPLTVKPDEVQTAIGILDEAFAQV